jgi:hypothetical protein
MSFYHLYDCVTGKEIKIYKEGLISKCKELGIDYTTLYKLGKGINHIQHRYILNERKDLITVLENIDTGIRYECVSNKTIFVHLGLPYSDLEAKYISAIRLGKQSLASVCGGVYRVSGSVNRKVKTMKNKSAEVDSKLDLQRIQRKIKDRVHNRIRHALEDSSIPHKRSIKNFLGCTNEFFYKFIEGKFTGKMSWSNKNLWHIDHIIPCSKFDLTDNMQQKKCFHYTNLQPIWATSKIAKEMGEPDSYTGNQNKSSTGLQYDYKLEEVIRERFPELNSIDFAVELSKRGVKKVA